MSRRKRYTRNLGRVLGSPLPVRGTVEWIRFEHEREPFGVFSYLDDAQKNLGTGLRAEVDDLCEWFEEHLDVPDHFLRERFWFKAEAREYVDRAKRLAQLVRRAGIPMVERRTHRIPGKVRWQDEHQVAVLTYRDAPQPRKRSR